MHLGSSIVAPLAVLLTAGVMLRLDPVSPQFSVGTELVEVYVSVSDSAGRPVEHLPRDLFTVREDGVVQSVATFAAGTMPLVLGVAVDRSFSMAGRPLSTAKSGARRLVGSLRPDDQTMLIAIGSQVETLVPLTADRQKVLTAVSSLTPWGTSPIGDATVAAIASVAAGTGRRALVLFTDGRERYNDTERATVLDRVRRGTVLIYPIAIGGAPTPLVAELAALSGGRAFEARDERQAERAAEALADDLRHQYLLGYVPSRPLDQRPETWRAIRVTVARPGVTVRARDGYFAGERHPGAASRQPQTSKSAKGPASEGCHTEGTRESARIPRFAAAAAECGPEAPPPQE